MKVIVLLLSVLLLDTLVLANNIDHANYGFAAANIIWCQLILGMIFFRLKF